MRAFSSSLRSTTLACPHARHGIPRAPDLCVPFAANGPSPRLLPPAGISLSGPEGLVAPTPCSAPYHGTPGAQGAGVEMALIRSRRQVGYAARFILGSD